MFTFLTRQKEKSLFSISAKLLVFILSFSLTLGPSVGYTQSALNLPAPGIMVSLSPIFTPTLVKGVRIYPDNPLRFDFIVDPGDSGLTGENLKEESSKLIKYFLASMTVPDEDMWVNLSPYEKDRIIADGFGKTEMGRDMLAQDYILKQITASLMYPEKEIGKEFWAKVYKKARDLYGASEVPVNTFNKVWIVPQKATVYQNGDIAFVTESYLKVMLEKDYLAMEHSSLNLTDGINNSKAANAKELDEVSSSIIKEIII